MQNLLIGLIAHLRAAVNLRFIVHLGGAILVVACSLLALAGCARQSLQAPSPVGSPATGAFLTATPLPPNPGPSIPAPLPTSTPRPTSTPPSWPLLEGEDVLPAPLYFVSNYQIYRIERDRSERQVTQPAAIQGYDVSPIDGTVVLASQGRLWLTDGDSNIPKAVVVGLPNPEATGSCFEIRDPVWSPDGKQIAYTDGGIRVFDLPSGRRIDIVENPDSDEVVFGLSWSHYSICDRGPQWSPAGDAILFWLQEPDWRKLMLVRLPSSQVVEIPFHSWTWQLAWSSDGQALLFDYGWSRSADLKVEPSFIRLTLSDLQTRVLRSFGDRVDRDYILGGYKPRWVLDPFQMPDGRILFFLGESCDSLPCPNYSLMEGVLSGDKINVRALHENVLPTGVDELVWHESGKYIALVLDKWQKPTIALLRVDTGEIFVVSRENSPTYDLRWGKQ